MNNTPPRSSNDRGWGVGEERPSRYVSDQRHSTVKQINSAVGYGACRRTEAFPINVIQTYSRSNALPRYVINAVPYKMYISSIDVLHDQMPYRGTSDTCVGADPYITFDDMKKADLFGSAFLYPYCHKWNARFKNSLPVLVRKMSSALRMISFSGVFCSLKSTISFASIRIWWSRVPICS